MKISFLKKKRKNIDLNIQKQNNFDFLLDEPVQQINTDNDIQNDQIMNTINENTRKSTRNRKTPSFLNDYYHNVLRVFNDKKTKYPISDVLNYKKLLEKHL